VGLWRARKKQTDVKNKNPLDDTSPRRVYSGTFMILLLMRKPPSMRHDEAGQLEL
jgi:hypothetical protein